MKGKRFERQGETTGGRFGGRPLWLAEKVAEHGAHLVVRTNDGKLTRLNRGSEYTTNELYLSTLRKALAGAQPVILDNVSDWMDEHGGNWPDDRLDPPGILPWPKVWCEWVDKSDAGAFKGVLLDTISWTAANLFFNTYGRAAMPSAREGLSRLQRLADGGFVAMQCFVYSDRWGEDVLALPLVVYGYTRDGVMVPGEHGNVRARGGRPGHEADCQLVISMPPPFECNTNTATEIFASSVVWRLFTALLNVKNIVVDDVPHERSSRRRLAKSGVVMASPRYKYLTVRYGKSGGGLSHGGGDSKLPFHVVRGNFADYSDGPGLFGKLHGLVWRPMHHRGDMRYGAVSKVYRAGVVER